MPRELTKPTFTINSTKPDNILEALRSALDATRAARAALSETLPHGRDYLDFAQCLRARQEHFDRQTALANIETELDVLAGHACDAVMAKRGS